MIGTTAQLTFRQVEEIIPPEARGAHRPSTRRSDPPTVRARTTKAQEVKTSTADDDTGRPEVTEDKSQAVNQEEVVYPSARKTRRASSTGSRRRSSPATSSSAPRPSSTRPSGTTGRCPSDMDGDGAEEVGRLHERPCLPPRRRRADQEPGCDRPRRQGRVGRRDAGARRRPTAGASSAGRASPAATRRSTPGPRPRRRPWPWFCAPVRSPSPSSSPRCGRCRRRSVRSRCRRACWPVPSGSLS